MARKKINIVRSPKQESFNELCKFADEYGFKVEIEKPFKEMDNLFLNIIKDNEIEQIILKDITHLNKQSAILLNHLSQKTK